MKRAVKVATQGVYILIGAAFLALGLVVLSLGTGLLPDWIESEIRAHGEDNPLTIHLIQEQATLIVLLGMLLLWFSQHYDESKAFHWIVTIYLFLDFFVHWHSASGGFDLDTSTVLNAIPFAVFLILGILRRITNNVASPANAT